MVPAHVQSGSGSNATLGVSGLVIVLAVLSVALRFYTQIFTRQGLHWDDWLRLVADIATLATFGLLLWGAFNDKIPMPMTMATLGWQDIRSSLI
jgi:hypothetical protein